MRTSNEIHLTDRIPSTHCAKCAKKLADSSTLKFLSSVNKPREVVNQMRTQHGETSLSKKVHSLSLSSPESIIATVAVSTCLCSINLATIDGIRPSTSATAVSVSIGTAGRG
jgi:hypothetical protein